MSAAKLPRRKASSKAKTQIGYAGKTCLSNFWVKIGFSRTELGALHQVAQLFKQPKGRTTANATALVLTTALVHWERLKPLLFADLKYAEAEGFAAWQMELFTDKVIAAKFKLAKGGR